MKKKIVFKTAAMIRNPQEQNIPAEISQKIDDWIMDQSDNTPTEVKNNVAKDNTMPIVEENKIVRLNINISTNTHKAIKKVCVDKGISITDFVTHLLQNEIGI
jgi:hypothetical protein